MRFNFIESISEKIVGGAPGKVLGGAPEIRHKSSVNWMQWFNFPNRVKKKTPEMALEKFQEEFFEKFLKEIKEKNPGLVSDKIAEGIFKEHPWGISKLNMKKFLKESLKTIHREFEQKLRQRY